MYEKLTTFIEKFDAIENGESKKAIASEFIEAVHKFMETHQNWELHTFATILKNRCEDFLVSDLSDVKLSALEGKVVIALILDSFKNHKCDYEVCLVHFEDGTVLKYLRRLKAIDEFVPKQEDVVLAHKASAFHRAQLEQDQVCGCFSCCKTFSSKKIEDWYDDGQTACCPYCCIDSVVGESSDYEITEEFLVAMEDYWFGCRKRSE